MSDRRSAILEAAIKVIARRGVRGLRVEQVAAEAGVAVSLIYYYFDNRNGLVRATLEHANERAATVAAPADGAALSGREAVERTLLAELDDGDQVRDTSVVWGEVLASAMFEPELRDQLREASETWSRARLGRDRGGRPRRVDPRRRRRACLRRAPDRAGGRAQRALARRRRDARARAGVAGGRRSTASSARSAPSSGAP